VSRLCSLALLLCPCSPSTWPLPLSGSLPAGLPLCPAALTSKRGYAVIPGVCAGLGNERSTVIIIEGKCSNLVVTKCCNIVLMVDEIAGACTVSESEHVSIVVRGTFPSPLAIRGVNGLCLTCGQNNVHSSVSGM
jgi:hypothetical protein